ncbi:MAG: serine hydrolase [Bryobacterales bacterium]|nr:serine hydrolase [Bryobacterales bacterium]
MNKSLRVAVFHGTSDFRYAGSVRVLVRLLTILGCFVLLGHAQPADLDQWVARVQRQFEVPGIAVGIVKDGRVVLAKGYGVRSLAHSGEVNSHTLFGIASNTKAFTAAAIAILVDEGRVAWDDPVSKYLPDFQLADGYVTREVTLRDLLSHRTGLGLGAGDLLYWPDTTHTREDVVRAARHLPLVSSFRSRYAYNNLCFVVAGQVVAAVTGKPWEDFVRERILVPLGMTETHITSVGLDQKVANVAMPHSKGWRLAGTLKPIPATTDAVWAAAAGIKSNVTDLTKWVGVQLAGGKLPNGNVLFSEKQAKEMWSAQIPVPITEPIPDLRATKPNFSAYGLGWALRDYAGHKLVTHTGGLAGMVSLTLMVPSERLGIVVLTNQEESGAFQSIGYHILDDYLGLPPTDWIAAYAASAAKTRREASEKEAKAFAARIPNTKPSLPLSRYALTYQDPWYGKAVIDIREGSLYLRLLATPAMHGRLEHFHLDTFVVHWEDPTVPDAYVLFTHEIDGSVAGFRMRATSDLADFSFDYQDLAFKAEHPEQSN